MKVISPKIMAELEILAYRQGYSAKDFMENAGRGIALATEAFIESRRLSHDVWLLCGKGNNGGDTLVAGCYLLQSGYRVTALMLEDLDNCSLLCQESARRFLSKNGCLLKQIPSFGTDGIILDGIFGTGFKGRIGPPYDSLVLAANQSGLPILAVDIPSGLNGETGSVEGEAIEAVETLFLGLPKSGFFLEEGWNLCGKLKPIDFGLPLFISESCRGDFILSTRKEINSFLPAIKRNRHKYQAGCVVGLAGSKSMPGAALLSSLAALRGGCGMMRLLYPNGMQAELSASPYEVIKEPYVYNDFEDVLNLMERGDASFIGPGLGRGEEVKRFVQSIMSSLKKPCVVDADTLAFFLEKPFKFCSEVIFTPHSGEMQRLLNVSEHLNLSLNLLETCQAYAEKWQITLIYKGAPTFIFHPGKEIHVNPTGDPGMATAGSGDVLTGLLAALLAQGLSAHQAALTGVYLHGLAGEHAAAARGTSRGIIASDIIAHFSDAYN